MTCSALLHSTGAWAGSILIHEAGKEGNGQDARAVLDGWAKDMVSSFQALKK